jgi:hypothetical protein
MKWFSRLAALLAISFAFSCFDVGKTPSWPAPARQALELLWPEASEAARADMTDTGRGDVKGLPVCIASRSWSAGSLGDSILFHYQREGRTLKVGYFVYWTSERPWGPNALSYSLLPALFIDAFYSHLFFLLPGAQRFIHGPGDVEGARVTYEQQDDGKWIPVAAVADDGFHDEVALSRDDFVDAQGRVVFMSDVWSHQLGAKGARAHAERLPSPGAVVCFDGDRLAPMTDEIARAFRLGSPADPRRAPPAWRLDAPTGETVKPSPTLQANLFGAIGRVGRLGR